MSDDNDLSFSERYTFPIFPVGRVITSEGTRQACSADYIRHCLIRHVIGDWGCTCKEDAALNDEAVKSGGRIFSAYPIDPHKPCDGREENCLWVISDTQKRRTTVFLPEEY